MRMSGPLSANFNPFDSDTCFSTSTIPSRGSGCAMCSVMRLAGTLLSETFKPKNDGELYVYLNKPVSGFWPGLFHDVSTGMARVRVVRIPNK